jgi:hypothetical protein
MIWRGCQEHNLLLKQFSKYLLAVSQHITTYTPSSVLERLHLIIVSPMLTLLIFSFPEHYTIGMQYHAYQRLLTAVLVLPWFKSSVPVLGSSPWFQSLGLLFGSSPWFQSLGWLLGGFLGRRGRSLTWIWKKKKVKLNVSVQEQVCSFSLGKHWPSY